ncbi:hypothetical protein AAES_155829 [Amazona aestiva]|uniref:Uncharacterized protein n=1 Tax=Amazona aestiva TaxID=12930 RepID=A0A0Q3LVU4_AMAAE|nr:hypothetical protein AAES_155829 [Amazona aestiva]
MLATGPWDFVLKLPHLSDESVAPVGFRGTPALSSQDGKEADEKTRSGKFALLNAKWGSFLVITEKCIITFDYAAIKDAEWQLLLLAEMGREEMVLEELV